MAAKNSGPLSISKCTKINDKYSNTLSTLQHFDAFPSMYSNPKTVKYSIFKYMFGRSQNAMFIISYKNQLNLPKNFPHKIGNVLKTMAFDYFCTYDLLPLCASVWYVPTKFERGTIWTNNRRFSLSEFMVPEELKKWLTGEIRQKSLWLNL